MTNVFFDPKQKSIFRRSEKTLKMGTQLEGTTVIEKMVLKDVEEDPVRMASLGIATPQVTAYNVSKIKRAVDQYKDKMAQMKEILRKEERVGREAKRKYDSTLSDLEKI